MSFCRWSSDDFRSDFYIYESDQGFEVDVARKRPGVDRDALPAPLSGTWRIFDTGPEAADWVEELVALGYCVPDGVVPALREAVRS